MKTKVNISVKAAKTISKNKIPTEILDVLFKWIGVVEKLGRESAKEIKGFKDHPLKGDRKGQRSIYLNKQWRAIYSIEKGNLEIITIEEITPHKY